MDTELTQENFLLSSQNKFFQLTNKHLYWTMNRAQEELLRWCGNQLESTSFFTFLLPNLAGGTGNKFWSQRVT